MAAVVSHSVKRARAEREPVPFEARFGVEAVLHSRTRPKTLVKRSIVKCTAGAMQSILSELIRQDRMIVTEDFSVDAPKTKQVLARLKELELDNVLIVVEEVDENLYLAARNLRNIDVIDVQGVNPRQFDWFRQGAFYCWRT
jgi:large subunit ribosomal protein L4